MSILVKLEVAKKQTYIFSSTALKDNISRSNHIGYVTSDRFFQEIAKDFYTTANNLVYSGGGHSVLQFETQEKAVEFTKVVTRYVLENFDGLELFVKTVPHDTTLFLKDSLKNLSIKLEEKKSIRKNQFHAIGLGIEALDATTFQAIEKTARPVLHMDFQLFSEFHFPQSFSDIDKNFLSVVHIDGNAMGTRIENIYKAPENKDFNTLAHNLNHFSKCIQEDFETAFRNMLLKVTEANGVDMDFDLEKCIPIRPIILAGDDVCFVTKGNIGIECARIFLEELAKLENKQDKGKYSACAGVAIVHSKYPFFRAYNLSEELCSNAKKFGKECDSDCTISAIDWHIEYGQMKNHLSEIKGEYDCEDGNRLTLRPMAVVDPNDKISLAFRKYDYFKTTMKQMQKAVASEKDLNRGKLKELRLAMKQGELETEYFIEKTRLGNIVYPMVAGEYGEDTVETIVEKGLSEKNRGVFKTLDGDDKKKYCSCFDVIELMDLYAEITEMKGV